MDDSVILLENEDSLPSRSSVNKCLQSFNVQRIRKRKHEDNTSGKSNKKLATMKQLDYQFTPWSQIEELIMARYFIYDSLYLGNTSDYSSEMEFNQSSQIFNRKFNLDAKPENIISEHLHLAHGCICDWIQRCTNLPNRSVQFIMQHLKSIECMVNILLEEFKLEIIQNNVENSNFSILYNLYSIGVINFCNVLSSYSDEIYSIRFLAKNLKCPLWIVQCRHDLAHACSNPPSLKTLKNAITFGLRWMDEYFWSANIHNEMQFRSIGPFPVLDYSPPQHLIYQNMERQKIYHNCWNVVLSPDCTGKRAANILKPIERYMNHDPNSFIGIVVQILISDVSRVSNQIIDLNSFRPLLLRRCSRLFHIVFAYEPEHMLLLLLNLIIDTVTDLQKSENIQLDSSLSIQIGCLWLEQIFKMIVMPLEKKQTSFEKSFLLLPDSKRLLHENQFAWYRLFHKLVKLDPNPILIRVTRIFYEQLLCDDRNIFLISWQKYQQILKLMKISIGNEYHTKNMNRSQPNGNILTVDELKKEIVSKKRLITPPLIRKNPNWNRVFIGACLN